MNQLLFTFLVIAVGGAMSTNITIGGSGGWTLGLAYTTVNANVGDSVLFFYSGAHAVSKFPDGTAYSTCDFSSATTLATESQGGGSGGFQNLYVYTVPAGLSYIACPVTGHCSSGMKVTITTTGSATTGDSTKNAVANFMLIVALVLYFCL